MDAVISAGPPAGKVDPLLEYAQVTSKALIPIGGKPMIKCVTDALTGSRYVDRLIIVGLDPSSRIDFGPKPVIYLPAQRHMISNYMAGVERVLQDTTDPHHILIATCDIPLITPSIVHDHISGMLRTDHDLHFSIIERSTMMTKYPTLAHTKIGTLTFARFREGVFCSGNIHMINGRVINNEVRDLWRGLLKGRKKMLHQVLFIGLGTLFRGFTGTLTLAAVELRAERILGVRCKAFVTKHAEIGLDIDNPSQLDIVNGKTHAARRHWFPEMFDLTKCVL